MQLDRVLFLTLLFFSQAKLLSPQTLLPSGVTHTSLTEICDNQIDDDADGLVDCYDPDCQCVTEIPCSVESLPSKFTTRLAWQSTIDAASGASTPVVGNLNPQEDNIPEIIVAESYTLDGILAYPTNRLLIFRGDGSNAATPLVLTIPGTTIATDPVPGPTIGDIDGDGIPELLISCNDLRIRVYHNYTENPVAPMSLWLISTDLLDFANQRPLLADFDGDGISEVYAGNDIFRFNFANPAAPTLDKVLSGSIYLGTNSMGRCYWRNYLRTGCNPTAADLLTPADCNGDPDCNGLELAAGPAIYSIDLDLTDGDGYEIKMQRRLPHTATLQYYDGYTAVADIDLDGILDVIVSAKVSHQHGVYAWNKNGLILFFPYPTNSFLSGALPCIANVYDDKTAGFAQDFPEILVGTSWSFSAFNLHAAQQNPIAPYWWDYNVTGSGGSGYNPAVTFDFNGDGVTEILYRGAEMKIMYGGATPFPPGVSSDRTWYAEANGIDILSDEYSVVADVDNDGEAEIVGCVAIDNTLVAYKCRLHVYESAEAPWVPCRNLWNQYNYFVVNINDDFSIPAQQQEHHLEIPAGSGQRPLNQYLTQRPALGAKIALPDATAEVLELYCQNNQLQLKLKICNQGDRKLEAGTPVTFYKSDPQTTSADLFGLPLILNTPLDVDSCIVFDLTLPPFNGVIYGMVNDDGSLPRPYNLALDFPATTTYECDWLNNIFEINYIQTSAPVDLGPDLALCFDTIITLRAGPGHDNYLWQNNSTDSIFVAQSAGTYWVRVEDQCISFRTDSIRIDVLGQPQLEIDTINGDCSGQVAYATVAVNSQYPPFLYKWTTGDLGPTISAVPDGLYAVTVTDAIGCSNVDSSWVEAGGLLQVAALTTDIPCTGQTGSIDLSIITGKPPYLFAWSDGSSGSTLQDVPTGNYTVTITDADACSQLLQISLTEPPPLTMSGINTTGACPGNTNGSASFLAINHGTPPYNFKWSTGSTLPALTDVAAGTYSISVTDALGCTLVENIQVPALEAPDVDAVVQDISCYGNADGSIAIDLTGGTPGFSYTWSNNSSAASIQNLSSGAYTLLLTFADGACTDIFDFEIKEPLPLVSIGVSVVASCPGEANGSANLLGISQGTAPYMYQWSDGSTATGLNAVAAGSYTVIVSDAHGCSLLESVQVPAFDAPILNSMVSEVSCAGLSDGHIILNISGGTPGFQYQWSNGPNTPNNLQLNAGTYSLALTYADGRCAQQFDFLISEPAPLLSNGLSATAACPGESNGAATFLGVSQGSPPYTLEWSTGSNLTTLTNVAAGTYSITVTDAHGCTLVQNIQVPELKAPIVDSVVQDISCFSNQNGSIAIALTGGSPGFSYTWSNSATTPSIQNLGPGTYTLLLTFADGACTDTFDFQIKEPQALTSAGTSVIASCLGETNGSVSLLGISQGTAPYLYQWSDGSTALGLNGVAAGIYTVVVTDTHGCSLVEMVQVPEFEVPIANTSTLDVSCFGAANGSVEITLSGGAPAFGYAWSTGATGPVIDSLGPGNYSLILSYGNGQCSLDFTFQVQEPTALNAKIAQTDSVNCFGESTAALIVTPAGGVLPYQFAWSSGQNTDALNHLSAGNYTVTITDANGCSAQNSIEIGQPAVLTLTPLLVADTCQYGTGAVSITASGGGQPYAYIWSTGAQSDHISGLMAGTYTLTLTDVKGCSQILPLVIPSQDDTPTLLLYADTLNCWQPTGFIGVSADQPNLMYSWTGPDGFLSDQAVPAVSVAGVYQVLVTNVYGCSAMAEVQVLADNLPPVAEIGSDQIQVPCQQTNLVLDATPGSTTGAQFEPIWYQQTGAGLTVVGNGSTLSIQSAGWYIFANLNTINGCSAFDSVLVDWIPPVLAAATVDSITCFGENDGLIQLQHLSGGIMPFTYSIDNQSFTGNNLFQNLAQGIYPVVVRDATGCQWQSVVSLSEPEKISVTLTASNTLINLGQLVLLNAIPMPPGVALTDIQWQPVGLGFEPGVLHQQAKPTESTQFTVQITDHRGCTATDRVTVEVDNYQIYAPTALLPGSSTNGYFTLYAGKGIAEIRLLQVYDRWGSLVFENRGFAAGDPAVGWDGSSRSQIFTPGVFVWYAELLGNDGRVIRLSGDVTVVR